jgi:hypothetical protein
VVGFLVLLGVGGAVAWWLTPTPRPTIKKGRAFNCWTVGKCSEDCARRCPNTLKKYPCMLDCDKRCKAKGCPSAQRISKALTDCVQRRCLMPCLSGPTPKCNGCTRTKCKAESDACIADRCK